MTVSHLAEGFAPFVEILAAKDLRVFTKLGGLVPFEQAPNGYAVDPPRRGKRSARLG